MQGDEEDSKWPVINQKYIVHMKIASGQQGSVVLATQKTTRQRFAIKIYKVKQEKDYFEKQVQLEMDILQASKSDYIIHLEEALQDATYVKPDGSATKINAIVMDYAPYGNFHDFIYLTGSFTETAAKYYFRQMILGLAYLHNNQNICHRDLKPDNLLLDKDLELKICDLGMSSHLSTTLNTLVGNLQFQAPEIHLAVSQLPSQPTTGYNGRNADVFSAGVILFLMLSGTYPFLNTKNYTDTTLQKYWISYRSRIQSAARSESNQTEQQSSSVAGSGSTSCSSSQHSQNGSKQQPISEQAIDLITQMLQKDPLNRISLAEIISHPWLAESANKKEVMEFMKVKIETYLKETRAELREKKKIIKDSSCNRAPGSNHQSTSLVYQGFQKFRSESSSSVLEKQYLTQEWISSLEKEKKSRQFQTYTNAEIGMHDFEFEVHNSENESNQNVPIVSQEDKNILIPPIVKSILKFLQSDQTISNISLHPCQYKITFAVTDSSNGDVSNVKVAIKTHATKSDLYLLSLTKNQGTKNLGLDTYQKLKGHILHMSC